MSISREQVDGLRWYEDDQGNRYMSVTTILKFLEEDDTGLTYWKKKHDGVGDRAHHQHLFWYAGHRGTLCHYQALCKFEGEYSGDEMWGEEEAYSMDAILNGPQNPEVIKEWEEEGVPRDTRSIAYSVMKNQGVVETQDDFEILFPSTDLIDILKKDAQYFTDIFSEVCDLLHIEDGVITVERFMLNDDIGYGGQCDLVYEAPDGAIVVADLKTSSALRQKHRLQSVAYAKAVEQSEDIDVENVDRVEVIRIQPDKEEWQIHSHEIPEYAKNIDRYTDAHWFDDKWGEFEYDSLDAMWEKFEELASTAHDSV